MSEQGAQAARGSGGSAIDVAFRFVEAINRLDLEGLVALMSDNYAFVEFSGERHEGLEAAGREGWRGYMTSFPEYMIHVSEVHEVGDTVYLAGSTTGSHLGLPRAEEFKDPLIWAAKIEGEKVVEWRLHYESPESRRELGLPPLGESRVSVRGTGA